MRVPLAVRRLLPEPLKVMGRAIVARHRRRRPLCLPVSAAARQSGRRALLSYVMAPFCLYPDDPQQFQFSNTGIARTWARVLDEMGYAVEVVDWDNARVHPKRPYDLFVGHGGGNFEQITRALPPQTPKLYFATTLAWREQNRREQERFDDLERRRGARLPPDRHIYDSEDFAYQSADGIVCLGNGNAKASYAAFPRVVNINNACFPNPNATLSGKDYAAGREHFLFFSSTGNVHKGLDLLLEAFAGTDAHLHICQRITPEFAAVYAAELARPNVHRYGYAHPRGPEFGALMQRCNFIIHPSCAEGQPGSVLECMQCGLIPVLSRENNINTDGLGLTLPECTVPHIADAVQFLRGQTPQWCQQRAEAARAAYARFHTPEAFAGSLRAALDGLLREGSRT